MRENVLAVGNCFYVAVCLLGGARRVGAHGGGERRGHIVAAARLQLVCLHCYPEDSKYSPFALTEAGYATVKLHMHDGMVRRRALS